MENDSPLKSWVRKHSPMRTKPLPARPVSSGSPSAERTFRAISGNTSPSKRSSTSKLRSFLRNKPQPPTPPRSSPSAQRPRSQDDRGRARSPPTEPHQQRSSIRKSLRTRRGSTDLRGLSQKIYSLEAQLKEARKELDQVSRSASNPHHAPDDDEYEIQKPTRRHRQSVVEGVRYERLVENLLTQRERDDDRQGLASKSAADLGSRFIESKASVRCADDQDSGFWDAEVIQHKRKRSEVRQASWERVQNHIQKQQQLLAQQPEAKRLRPSGGNVLSSVSPRSKELPELPEFPKPDSLGGFIIQSSPDDAEDNGCPPLNRHQRSFSQPTASSSATAPKPTKHRRRRSQIIEQAQLQEAFGDSTEDGSQRQALSDARAAANGQARKVNPPSPNRRQCHSRSRLDKVEEEYEWDEEIF